jgi:hypothetical protein
MVLTVLLLYLASFLILVALYLATDRRQEPSSGIFDDWHERHHQRDTRAAAKTSPSREDGMRV